MAELVAAPSRSRHATKRALWLAGTIAVTVVPLVLVVVAAPPAGAKPAAALMWLLFVASSVHVGATAWFYSVREVRAHMARHPARYVYAPIALVVAAAVVATTVSASTVTWVVLAFFAWQFVHFQKQNLGVAALTAKARGAASLTRSERRALIGSGVGGVLGLLGDPDLLQVSGVHRLDRLFAGGAALFLVSVVVGGVALAGRPDRDPVFTTVYAISLLFFLPVWLFSSPYAAVAGLTIAHGLQYLLLVGLVAAAPGTERPVRLSLLIMINLALVIGIVLNRMSHQHDGTVVGQALFGGYLGLSMAHFVIDGGLWRLRDEFPRAFLAERLPFLLAAGR